MSKRDESPSVERTGSNVWCVGMCMSVGYKKHEFCVFDDYDYALEFFMSLEYSPYYNTVRVKEAHLWEM